MSTEEEQFAKAAQAELANPPDGAPSDEGGKLKQLLVSPFAVPVPC